MKRLSVIGLRILALFAVFFSQQGELFADRNGITGQTINGCTCHSLSSSPSTTVSHNIPGSTLTVAPGSTTAITAYVAHATLPLAGINISVKDGAGTNAGTFVAGAGLRLANGELTQNTPQSITGTPRRAQFLFQWIAPTTPGVYTLRMAGIAVNNNNTVTGDEWNSLTPTLTITVPGIAVTSPNGNEQWCRGSTQIIKWNSVGIAQVNIDISSNLGQNWVGVAGPITASSGQWTWNIPSGMQVGGGYLVRVSNAANRDVNDLSNSPFYIQAQPDILTQPSGLTVCQGEKARFTVGMDNPAYYLFQWRKDGQIINNARSYTYEISSAAIGTHDGTYDVVITSCGNSVVSSPVVLTIHRPPTIVSEPSDVFVCPGEPATLMIGATGDITKYEWRKNGKLVANSNVTQITFPALAAKDTGVYEATVVGTCLPSASSRKVTLGFVPPPRLLNGLRDTAICEGAPLILEVDPLDIISKYEWRRGATVIPGEEKQSLTIPSVGIAEAGQYSVTMTNRCGNTSSSLTHVSVVKLPVIVSQSSDTVVLAADPLTIKVVATGDNIRYQWRFKGAVLPNETLPILILSSVLPKDTGAYECVVSNQCTERIAIIKVGVNGSSGPLLTLGGKPLDFGCVRPGSSRNFTFPNWIRNDGGATLTISGSRIIGADSADFSIVDGGGAYQLAAGTTRSLVVKFTPSSTGVKQAQVEFTSNSTSGLLRTFDLIGRGCLNCINVQRIIFDSIGIGQTKDSVIRLCNSCNAPFVGQRLDTITDGQFLLSDHEGLPKTLQPGGCILMTVRYAPTTAGPASGLVRLISGSETHLVELLSTRGTLTGVDDIPESQPISIYPNPMSTGAIIRAANAQTISITDAFGREITRFGREIMPDGAAKWNGAMTDGSQCPAGVYFVIVRTGAATSVAPLLITR